MSVAVGDRTEDVIGEGDTVIFRLIGGGKNIQGWRDEFHTGFIHGDRSNLHIGTQRIAGKITTAWHAPCLGIARKQSKGRIDLIIGPQGIGGQIIMTLDRRKQTRARDNLIIGQCSGNTQINGLLAFD